MAMLKGDGNSCNPGNARPNPSAWRHFSRGQHGKGRYTASLGTGSRDTLVETDVLASCKLVYDGAS